MYSFYNKMAVLLDFNCIAMYIRCVVCCLHRSGTLLTYVMRVSMLVGSIINTQHRITFLLYKSTTASQPRCVKKLHEF